MKEAPAAPSVTSRESSSSAAASRQSFQVGSPQSDRLPASAVIRFSQRPQWSNERMQAKELTAEVDPFPDPSVNDCELAL